MSDNKPYENKESSIHTLESDLASAVRNENYGKNIIKIVTDPTKNSTFQTNFDENDKKEGVFSFFTKKTIIVMVVIVLILSSLSVILYILYKAKNVEKDKNEQEIQDIAVETGDKVDINKPIVKNNNILNSEIIQSSDFSNMNRNEIVFEINKIKDLLLSKKIEANNNININTNLNVVQFFEKIKYSGDESFLRSFDNTYAFGLYSVENNKFETYLLIKVNNFDLSFKSILDWEKYIALDLKDIFIGNNIISTSTISSAASSTKNEDKYYKKNTDIFIDKILKNHDIREYVKNEDNTDIIYGFINNKFLLITSGESSFIDIKNRLLKENILR